MDGISDGCIEIQIDMRESNFIVGQTHEGFRNPALPVINPVGVADERFDFCQ